VPTGTAPAIRAVYFDIGETLLDRTREYAAWASWLGVPAHTFSAVFGAMIAAGHPVRDVVAVFAPEPGFAEQRHAMTEAGVVPPLAEQDVYPDVRPALRALRELGLRVGIAGNQPAGISDELRDLDLPADEVRTSDDWHLAKPDPRFFTKIVEACHCPPDEIVYVGDQLANDVTAAVDAGLRSVRLLRGPWGMLQRDPAVEARCLAVVGSLTELPSLLGPLLARRAQH
jgi:FMN phosphatase YigB (HAD superfamily)